MFLPLVQLHHFADCLSCGSNRQSYSAGPEKFLFTGDFAMPFALVQPQRDSYTFCKSVRPCTAKEFCMPVK